MIVIDKEDFKKIQNYDSRHIEYCKFLTNLYWQINEGFLKIYLDEDQSCLFNFPFSEKFITPDALTIEYSKRYDWKIWQIIIKTEKINRFSFEFDDALNIEGFKNYKLKLVVESDKDKFSLEIESFVKRYELRFFNFHKVSVILG